MPRDAAALAPDASVANHVSPVLVGVALPLATTACDKPAFDDCALANVTRDAQLRPAPLPGCTLAETVQLREIDQYSKRGLLVLRHGKDVVTADLLSSAATWDPVTTKYLPRLRLVRAVCDGNVADIAIATSDARTIHIQCRPQSCVRDTDLATGGVTLAAFLADVKRATEAHDWNTLTALCSPEHRRSQMGELHQDRMTYLAEILGVHAAGNSVNDNQVTAADLATLGAITYVDIVKANDGFAVVGLIARKDAPPLRIELTVTPAAGGHFWLTGGVG